MGTDDTNTFTWDIKSERNSFGLTGNDKDKEGSGFIHPAWETFSTSHKIITEKEENCAYYTTAQLLDRLNEICFEKYYNEDDLFKYLTDVLSKTPYNPPGSSLYFWLFTLKG